MCINWGCYCHRKVWEAMAREAMAAANKEEEDNAKQDD